MAFIWGNSNPNYGDLGCDQYEITKLGFPCTIGEGVITWLILMAKLV